MSLRGGRGEWTEGNCRGLYDAVSCGRGRVAASCGRGRVASDSGSTADAELVPGALHPTPPCRAGRLSPRDFAETPQGDRPERAGELPRAQMWIRLSFLLIDGGSRSFGMCGLVRAVAM